ncbi:MAG TPA: hypothetical protein VGR11_13515 [Solirubrobacteraceae bacterium]|nr:hypothetical protein [Solirubrobacteraceae bacterium]
MALVAIAAALAGCGEEDTPAPSEVERQAHLTVSEIEAELEGAGLALVRSGAGEPDPDREGVVDVVEYQEQSNEQFELFVFTSPDAAQRELPELVADAREQHGGDATAVPAANSVAVFRGRPDSVEAYRVAAEVMSRLGAACIRGSDAEKRLQRLCFGA